MAERNWYVEAIAHMWARNAVSHLTEGEARDHARTSLECLEVRVYDCSRSNIGRLAARYVRGEDKGGDPTEPIESHCFDSVSVSTEAQP